MHTDVFFQEMTCLCPGQADQTLFLSNGNSALPLLGEPFVADQLLNTFHYLVFADSAIGRRVMTLGI